MAPLILLFLAVSIVLVMWLGARHVPRLEPWLDGFGGWGPVIYLAVCTLAAVLLVPGSVTKLAAGALFGFADGLLWGFLGAALGSVAAFSVARIGRRTWIETWLRGLPRMSRFDASVAQHGRRIVFLMRLSPVVPFSIINYALGLSRVRFRDYLIGAPGMLPSVFLYVYSGGIAQEVMEAAAGATFDKPWWEWAILAVGLVATILATHVVTKKAKEALASDDEDPDEQAEDVIDELEEAALGR